MSSFTQASKTKGSSWRDRHPGEASTPRPVWEKKSETKFSGIPSSLPSTSPPARGRFPINTSFSSPPSSPPHKRERSTDSNASSSTTASSVSASSLSLGPTSNSWRARASAPATSSRSSLPVFKDVSLGQVFQLHEPPANSILHQEIAGSGDLVQEPWNHPVVVVGKSYDASGEPLVTFCGCTSFGGRPIEEAKKLAYHSQFVLAENKMDVQPHAGTQLAKVEYGSKCFDKRTYVCIKSKYTVEYKNLAKFGNGGCFKFDAAATQSIMNYSPYYNPFSC